MASCEPVGLEKPLAELYTKSCPQSCGFHVQTTTLQRTDTQHIQAQTKKRVSPQRERFHSNFDFIKPRDRDRALEKARSFCKDMYFLLLNIKRTVYLLLCLGENIKPDLYWAVHVCWFCAHWELPATDQKTSGPTPMLDCHGLQHDGLLWITSQKTLSMGFIWPDGCFSSSHANDELDSLYGESISVLVLAGIELNCAAAVSAAFYVYTWRCTQGCEMISMLETAAHEQQLCRKTPS